MASFQALVVVLVISAFCQIAAAQRNPYISEDPFNRWMHAGIALAVCWSILATIWGTVRLIHHNFGRKYA